MQIVPPVWSCVLLVAYLLLTSLPVLAQRPGGGGPPSGMGGMSGMPGGGMPNAGSLPGGSPRAGNGPLEPRTDSPTNTTSQPSTSVGTMRGGLQLGPPGRWWDDKHYVKALHLRPEQQKRMDGLFDENRGMLVSRFQTLQQEESKMEALSRASNLDEATLFSQIDRVAQARADLEKANTHLMLQVRKEMDADQVSRLDKDR